jgi:hypothetical protein
VGVRLRTIEKAPNPRYRDGSLLLTRYHPTSLNRSPRLSVVRYRGRTGHTYLITTIFLRWPLRSAFSKLSPLGFHPPQVAGASPLAYSSPSTRYYTNCVYVSMIHTCPPSVKSQSPPLLACLTAPPPNPKHSPSHFFTFLEHFPPILAPSLPCTFSPVPERNHRDTEKPKELSSLCLRRVRSLPWGSPVAVVQILDNGAVR